MSTNETFYFCLKLSENEHYIMEDNFHEKCSELGLEIVYYRKLKEGHKPLFREIKISGPRGNLFVFGGYLKNEMKIEIKQNPYRMSDDEYMDEFFSELKTLLLSKANNLAGNNMCE